MNLERKRAAVKRRAFDMPVKKRYLKPMADLEGFLAGLARDYPDPELDEVLKALWWDKKGDWDFAHSIAQHIPTDLGSAVHAYLHRKEGVLWNADYWYAHAGRSRPDCSLEEEWRSLAEEACDYYRQDLP